MPNNIGSVPRIASTKKRLIIFGGVRGSDLNMWWISGFATYRSGSAGAIGGETGSVWIMRSKAWLLYGFDVPNEARMTDAFNGLSEVTN